MKKELFQLHAEIEDSHWWFAGRRQIIERLALEAVPPSKSTTVVDVGCGTGANIAALAAHYRCVGIDPTPDAIEFARRRFPSVRFICGFAPDDLGEIAREARLFIMTDVLEHLPSDVDMLSRLLAACSPGAQLLITVPADESLWSEHDVSFGHYRRYDAKRLALAWRGLPVSVRLLSYYNSRLFPIVKVVRTLTRVRGRSTGEHGTDLSLPPAPINRALTSFFAGEAAPLRAALRGERGRPYGAGVSLVAILRREAGEITLPVPAAHIPADLHQPV